jgi:hypothetical protein
MNPELRCAQTFEELIDEDELEENLCLQSTGCCVRLPVYDVSNYIHSVEQPEIAEIDVSEFVDVNVDLVLKRIHASTLIRLFAFSKIRKTFEVSVVWAHNSNLLIKLININAPKLIDVFNVESDEQFVLYLKQALQKIWNAHFCQHCETLLFEESLSCIKCDLLSCLTYKDRQCIICQESAHPIIFRCETCIDSQICVRCEKKLQKRHECQVCHKSSC